MEAVTLYEKERPSCLADIVGQQEAVAKIKRLVEPALGGQSMVDFGSEWYGQDDTGADPGPNGGRGLSCVVRGGGTDAGAFYQTTLGLVGGPWIQGYREPHLAQRAKGAHLDTRQPDIGPGRVCMGVAAFPGDHLAGRVRDGRADWLGGSRWMCR